MKLKLNWTKNSYNTWANKYLYPGTQQTFGAYLAANGAPYTGLSVEDELRLEDALRLEPGTLNKRNAEYWNKFKVLMTLKGGPDIDTETPEGELLYLFLRGHKDVAVDTLHVGPNHKYVLVDKEAEAVEANKKSKTKREAYLEFSKMSTTDWVKFLRILGRSSKEKSMEIVEQTVSTFVEEEPNQFLNLWVRNKNREMQYLIEEAISCNVIRRNKNIYYYGTDVIGNSMEDTIASLQDKKNLDIRKTIEALVEARNK